jgi:hypothetical protein
LGSWILLALFKAYNDLQSNIVEKVILWLLIIGKFTMTMMPSLSSDCDAVHIWHCCSSLLTVGRFSLLLFVTSKLPPLNPYDVCDTGKAHFNFLRGVHFVWSSVRDCLMFQFFLDCDLLLCLRLPIVTTVLSWEVHCEHPGS